MGVLSVWSVHLWFGEGTLTLVGVPLVWWVYLWFGGVPLVTFSLVGYPWLGVETLGYCHFGLGTLSFVGKTLVCLVSLSLVGFPQFLWVLIVFLGYRRFFGVS